MDQIWQEGSRGVERRQRGKAPDELMSKASHCCNASYAALSQHPTAVKHLEAKHHWDLDGWWNKEYLNVVQNQVCLQFVLYFKKKKDGEGLEYSKVILFDIRTFSELDI